MSGQAEPKVQPKNNTEFLLVCLAALVAVVLVSTVLQKSVGKKETHVLAASNVAAPKTIDPPRIKDNAAPLPNITAKSYYAIDVKTESKLLTKDEKEPALPASTTKMATALVAMSVFNLDEVITVGDIKVDGHKMGLVVGEQITVKNLLYGLLIFSGNDAAEALAANYPGGRSNFIVVMNQLASRLGLENTHFTNPVGLDEYLHFSSAEDLVKLAEYGIQNPLFAQIVGTKDYQISSVDGKIVHRVENTNELVDKMPGILGVKTGWTENSGQDLVTLYEKDGHRVMLSVLGSSDRFGETEKILNWIFDNYEWK